MAAVIASDLELQLTVLSHRLCELESSLEYFSEFGIATPANLILGRPRQHDLDSGGEAIKMMKKTREEASEVIKKKTALQRQIRDLRVQLKEQNRDITAGDKKVV